MVQDNVNMDRYQKRERTQNWSPEEKRYLLELVKRDMVVLENKKLDADLTTLKNRAWKIIHREFSKTYGNERNCNRLKEQWRRMKASTRSELLDYNHRVSNFGIEVADKKRPSPFTMQVWEFMQEAKLACGKENMETDYSKVRLSLEDLVPDGFVFESDDDASNSWHNESANTSHLEVKLEFPAGINDSQQSTSTSPAAKRSYSHAFDDITFPGNGTNGCDDDQPMPGMNDVSQTIDALNLLKSGFLASAMANAGAGANTFNLMNGGGGAFGEQHLIMDMQRKEHQVRMEVLQMQLETARYNREAAEINKLIAMRNLKVLATSQCDEQVNGNGNIH